MKELIERLEAYRLYVEKTYNELSSIAQLSRGDVDAVSAPLHLLLTEAIAALQSMPQWVKCSERMPEDHPYTEYLVACSFRSKDHNYDAVDVARFLKHKNLWLHSYGEEQVF